MPRKFRMGYGPHRKFLWGRIGPWYFSVALYWGWALMPCWWKTFLWWDRPGGAPILHIGPLTITLWSRNGS